MNNKENIYIPKLFEKKWEMIWKEEKIFHVSNNIELLIKKPKFYILDMFPYPSGSGLHVGHPRGYTATDVISKLYKMKGYNVLHPMGWDSFGLPTERAANKENVSPSIITKRNVRNFKKQINRLGFGYDWDREIYTSDKLYYKWTQWIFTKLYERGLAYKAQVAVNWCPALKTVLANEEVKDGYYIETGDVVENRFMYQWMLRITKYAESLLDGLNSLDWPQHIKDMQSNWIGKSIGWNIKFKVYNSNLDIEIFTTTPEVIYGITFIATSPNSNLSDYLYNNNMLKKIDLDLLKKNENNEKVGIKTKAYATHPITGCNIPIWITNYVIDKYGSGSIMGVPAHDDRDNEFAEKYNINTIKVLTLDKKLNIDILISSQIFNGYTRIKARQLIISYLMKKNIIKESIQYKLRDWLFSRQRYWGEPFPIGYKKDGSIKLIPKSYLPIELPLINIFKDIDKKNDLLNNNWTSLKIDGELIRMESHTMPQWAGSCWYYLRYLDPLNNEKPWSEQVENYWMPVDIYVGGAEHAVLHLLYARFWHKVLYDCKLVHTKEPFKKLISQGIILSKSYKDQSGKYYKIEDIYINNNKYFSKNNDNKLDVKIEKMSKSKLNVFNPDKYIDEYGADAFRLYELFLGPFEQSIIWNDRGISGVFRFLNRVWSLIINPLNGLLNSYIINEKNIKNRKSYDLLFEIFSTTLNTFEKNTINFKFNVAISDLMIFINKIYNIRPLAINIIKDFIKILYPYAPFISEEIWFKLGEKTNLALHKWPQYKNIISKVLMLVVQLNGKKILLLEINNSYSFKQIMKIILENKKLKNSFHGKFIKNIIYVNKKLINFLK